jgi:hypothetical protein
MDCTRHGHARSIHSVSICGSDGGEIDDCTVIVRSVVVGCRVRKQLTPQPRRRMFRVSVYRFVVHEPLEFSCNRARAKRVAVFYRAALLKLESSLGAPTGPQQLNGLA